MTSDYARQEAELNISGKRFQSLPELKRLLARVEINNASKPLESNHNLPDKDRPILEAAVGCDCSVLITGDIKHFGHLIGEEIDGVLVMTAAMFFHRNV